LSFLKQIEIFPKIELNLYLFNFCQLLMTQPKIPKPKPKPKPKVTKQRTPKGLEQYKMYLQAKLICDLELVSHVDGRSPKTLLEYTTHLCNDYSFYEIYDPETRLIDKDAERVYQQYKSYKSSPKKACDDEKCC
jgi:hypothetical protein